MSDKYRVIKSGCYAMVKGKLVQLAVGSEHKGEAPEAYAGKCEPVIDQAQFRSQVEMLKQSGA